MKRYKYGFLLILLVVYWNHVCAQLDGRALIDSMVSAVGMAKEDTNKVRLLDDLSYEYSMVSPADGMKYARQAILLATKLNWKKGQGIVYNTIGLNYRRTSENDKALEFYFKAARVDSEVGNMKELGIVLANIGNIYEKLGKYPIALEYCFRGLKISEEVGNKSKVANTSNYIGTIYMDMGDKSNALKYFFKALSINKEQGNKRAVAMVTGNIGCIYDDLKDYQKALEFYGEANKIDEELGNEDGLATNYGNIGIVYIKLKKYNVALDNFFKVLKIAERHENKDNIAMVCNFIGETFISLVKDTSQVNAIDHQRHDSVPTARSARLQKAVNYLLRGVEISKEISSLEILELCYKNLAAASKLSGDFETALEYTDKYNAIDDSVLSNDNKLKMANLATKRESELKEKQIAINKLQSEKKNSQQIFFGVTLGLMLIVVSGLFFNLNFVRKSRKAIQKEKDISEGLLLNILPAEVAAELKEKGASEAKLIDDVTVLFTDFQGFTQLSEQFSPKELVSEIHDCFSAFDHIMQKHGIEKIKTIGDSYMAAGGLPTPNKTHPVDIVRAALEIQEYMRQHKLKKEADGKLFFEIRIGVNTGPVVAGIVGVKKFQYDIWGDTVNTASRMESSGVAGKVNISGTTYELVKNNFNCEYRGEIDAKGKGKLKMYYVS